MRDTVETKPRSTAGKIIWDVEKNPQAFILYFVLFLFHFLPACRYLHFSRFAPSQGIYLTYVTYMFASHHKSSQWAHLWGSLGSDFIQIELKNISINTIKKPKFSFAMNIALIPKSKLICKQA